MPSVAIVIPQGPGREDNVRAVLEHLKAQTVVPTGVAIVEDGPVERVLALDEPFDIVTVPCIKHEPGREQPRNVGVRVVRDLWDATHVWFIDSDVIVEPHALEQLLQGLDQGPEDRILVAPYDWMGPGSRQLQPGLHNDPRWEMFLNSPPDVVYRNDLSAGLACFSGNLMWPVGEFERVGGFWNELHHGRCEDGELGLRAVAMDVPISLVATARGYHLWHEVNTDLAITRNARDVPMLNERHPWMERGAVFMVDRDGKAFDARCPCGEVVPTILWWQHAADCQHTGLSLPVARK